MRKKRTEETENIFSYRNSFVEMQLPYSYTIFHVTLLHRRFSDADADGADYKHIVSFEKSFVVAVAV